jgi:monolysocardiolipin acyltransferase
MFEVDRLDSWFFRKGQVIETFRGKGIYQKAIDDAVSKLDDGRWVRPSPPPLVSSACCRSFRNATLQVHIFPEGRIKQETLSELRRFKWGISRMLMESQRTPLIVPIWIKGKHSFCSLRSVSANDPHWQASNK